MNAVTAPTIGQEFFILIRRYDVNDPRPGSHWGVHKMVPVTETTDDIFRHARPFNWERRSANKEIRAAQWEAQKGTPDYRHETVGLVTDSKLAQIMELEGLVRMPVPDDLKEYVYFQCSPIEWHSGLKNGLEAVTARCEIMVKA